MKTESTEKQEGDKNPMPEQNEGKLVAELAEAKTKALQQVSDLTSEKTRQDALISEMKGKVETLASVEKLVAEFAGSTVAEKIGKLVSELSDLRKAQQKTQIDGWIAEAVKAVELESLRPTIIAQMGEIDSEAKAKSRVEELLKRDDIKVIAEALAYKSAGPNAFVGNKNSAKDANSLKNLNNPETIAEARQWAGI
jgi:hypothetical protein